MFERFDSHRFSRHDGFLTASDGVIQPVNSWCPDRDTPPRDIYRHLKAGKVP